MEKRVRDKHVLMVTTVFPRWRGDATPPFILSQAVHLRKQGWCVTVLAPHSPGASRDEVWEGIRVIRFRYLLPERMQTLCYEGGILTQLARAPWKRWQLSFLCAAELLAVRRMCRCFDFDLVHAHSIIPQGLVVWLRFFSANRPVVISSHGADVFSLAATGFYGSLKRKVLRHATLVTTNSSVGREALLKLGVLESKIRVVPSTPSIAPVQPDEVAAIRERYASDGARLILFVGRLIPQKGVADLLEALALLPSLEGVRLVVVGDGSERAALESRASCSDLSAHVEFTGWLAPEQLTSYFEAADLFVAPSKPAADGAVESQGLVFVESMAAKTALIGTRCGGIVDMIQHEATGLLVPPANPKELSAAIQRLLEDASLRGDLASRAHALYEAKFSPEVVTRQLIRVYEEALAATCESS